MKSIARIHVWWPGIDKKIVKGSLPYQNNRNKPPLTSLHLWNWPSQPWRRLHLDFLGPFLKATFLIASSRCLFEMVGSDTHVFNNCTKNYHRTSEALCN